MPMEFNVLAEAIKSLIDVKLPALLAAVKPIGTAEAEGCGTGDGLAIHPARDVGRAPGVGWNGYTCINKIRTIDCNT